MKKALQALLFTLTTQVAVGSLATEPQANVTSEQEEPQWYQADLVVFLNQRSMNDQGAYSEQWPEISPHTIPVNAIALKNPEDISTSKTSNFLTLLGDSTQSEIIIDIKRDAFVALPSEKHALLSQGNTLDRQNGYRVLNRTAWLMPIKDESTSQPVKIKAYNSRGRPSLLEGSVTISSSRFLHVDVDLWYSELAPEGLSANIPFDEQELSEGKSPKDSTRKKPVVRRNTQLVMDPSGTPMKITRNFHISESRRIRNTEEVHYLDSPVVGVLIKLTPYDRPDAPLLPEIDAFAAPNQYGQLPRIQTKDNG